MKAEIRDNLIYFALKCERSEAQLEIDRNNLRDAAFVAYASGESCLSIAKTIDVSLDEVIRMIVKVKILITSCLSMGYDEKLIAQMVDIPVEQLEQFRRD